MTDISKFKTRQVSKRQLGFFSETELESLKGKLPEEVIAFLKEEGRCTYNNDFLWTVMPDEYYSMLQEWNLDRIKIDPMKCHVFLRSSFGSMVYCYAGKYYYLSPFLGENSPIGSGGFDSLMNTQLSMNLVLKGSFWLDIHKTNREHLPDLKEDEIYALVPAIPLGGSPETSKIEVVKMREQLAILAGLYEHTATED